MIWGPGLFVCSNFNFVICSSATWSSACFIAKLCPLFNFWKSKIKFRSAWKFNFNKLQPIITVTNFKTHPFPVVHKYASALQRDYTWRLFLYQMLDKMAEKAILDGNFVQSRDGGSLAGVLWFNPCCWSLFPISCQSYCHLLFSRLSLSRCLHAVLVTSDVYSCELSVFKVPIWKLCGCPSEP